MKHYIDKTTNELYAFEDSDSDAIIPSKLTKITTLRPTNEHTYDVTKNTWVAPVAIDPWLAIRAERNALLAATDYFGSSDMTMPSTVKTYRQALRDITTQTDPTNIVWPTKPKAVA